MHRELSLAQIDKTVRVWDAKAGESVADPI
jgi:hypothetical protein